MARSQRKLAETTGVAKTTIVNAKKSLGITSKTLSEEEEQAVIDKAMETVRLQQSAKQKMSKTSEGYVPNVRRIDQRDASSILDLLQDCEEQYVRNEELIQRLQYEVSQQDILMHGNSNGTLSPLPQLKMIQDYQKINITLRNQIKEFENDIGRVAKPHEADDPFE